VRVPVPVRHGVLEPGRGPLEPRPVLHKVLVRRAHPVQGAVVLVAALEQGEEPLELEIGPAGLGGHALGAGLERTERPPLGDGVGPLVEHRLFAAHDAHDHQIRHFYAARSPIYLLLQEGKQCF